MAEFPALPLFTDAYVADTRHLTAAQHGAYLLLLMTAWRMPDCALPDDDEKLHRWACMDRRTWQRNKPIVMDFWRKRHDGKWEQRRLVDERKYVNDVRSRKSDAGKASALKRKERHSTSVEQHNNRAVAPTLTPTLKEDSVSDETAAAATVVDFKKTIFDQGLSFVSSRTNKPPNALRGLFGKWCKEYGDSAVAGALVQAQQASAVDPIAYITKTLQGGFNAKPKRHTNFAEQDYYAGTEGFNVIG